MSLLLPLPQAAFAEGVPEPSLILYGTILNTGDKNIRLVSGSLTWQFRKTATSRTVTAIGQVTNVLDQFSYVLEVPCETIIAGATISSNALDLTPTPAVFDRSQVFVGAAPASFVVPALATTSVSSTNRGRIERVDLTVNIPIVDTDGNGMPDDWETRYFGGVGVEPAAGDFDGDGQSNFEEYCAGTDPTDPSSVFRFVHYFQQPSGGFQVEWISGEGRFYVLERSHNLLSGFSILRTNISATPTTNRFLDASAVGAGPYFYRVRLAD